MRLWPSVVLLAAVLPVLCFGQAEGTDKTLPTPSEVLLEIPKCAQSCLTSTVSKSSCSLDDMKCICDSKAIEDEASKCILSSCPLPQALAAKNITSSACKYPVRDKAGQYSAMSISLGTITVLLVLIRVAFKQFFSTAQSLGPDDKVILGTLALRISCTIINVQGLAAHGLGKDVWTMDPSELTTFVKFLYVMEILYLAELSLIKLSLSLFYLFIFPGAIIRRLLWGTAIFNILFGVAFVVTAVFQCSPISYYWTQYVEHSGGNCVNINVFGWANAAISVAADIWLIALPLSQVRALNLHWKKKLGVTVMFLTGAFVTIVSILRLRSLIFFANSSNPTWDQWSIAYWSTIEVNVGMICTCLPSLRLILLRLFPQLGSGSRSGRSYGVQSQAQTNASKRLSNKEQHHLSDLESSKGHPWQRIDTESIS